MMPYRFHPVANDEYNDLLVWYESHQQGLWNNVAADFEEFIGRIRRMPLMYAKVTGASSAFNIRIGATSRKSIVVIYEVHPTEVVILSVSHANARRRPWRNRLSSD